MGNAGGKVPGPAQLQVISPFAELRWCIAEGPCEISLRGWARKEADGRCVRLPLSLRTCGRHGGWREQEAVVQSLRESERERGLRLSAELFAGDCDILSDNFHDSSGDPMNHTHPGGNPGANLKSNLPQMPPDPGGICMGVD